ncbi:MAG: GNAT family N-acetyltransferase [Chthoniobacter sp.]|uniref:GNAT family N-acetyltransferase n=1 Tax=Chthoniobacter sp. TaxID=2510640 RepID=UPI0032AA238F
MESLYRELVSDPNIHVLPEQIAAMAASPHSLLLVAEIDALVCATVLLILCPDAMYGTQPFGVIENIVVTPQMRGWGLGRLLLGQVERLAADHHCTKLMLLSSHTRHEAHAFFKRCGFDSDTKHAFVKYRRDFAAR